MVGMRVRDEGEGDDGSPWGSGFVQNRVMVRFRSESGSVEVRPRVQGSTVCNHNLIKRHVLSLSAQSLLFVAVPRRCGSQSTGGNSMHPPLNNRPRGRVRVQQSRGG